ncbi:MAG: Rap1a/Tai family immunity protein [Candidatus Phaeomarinobacter sp.]
MHKNGILGLTGAVIAMAALVMWVGSATAKPRVESGQDLYNACERAVRDFDAGRTPQDSVAIYHCNHFLSGLFRSHQVMTRNRLTAKQHSNEDTDRVQCLKVPQAASFKQLAQKVVNQAEWQPELLDKPATELAFSAFDALNPC